LLRAARYFGLSFGKVMSIDDSIEANELKHSTTPADNLNPSLIWERSLHSSSASEPLGRGTTHP
jgi:hypothetical protein